MRTKHFQTKVFWHRNHESWIYILKEYTKNIPHMKNDHLLISNYKILENRITNVNQKTVKKLQRMQTILNISK
jgi:hypothetical protein